MILLLLYLKHVIKPLGYNLGCYNLTVNHIIPFKDKQEMLKKPPVEYSFIEDEDWNILVKDRLSNAFQVKPLNHATSINM